MLKTPLEGLLEDGFSELGGFFEQRQYGEQVRRDARDDDEKRPVSVDDIRKRIAKASTPEERFITGFSQFDLSDAQNAVLNDLVPFFKRDGLYRNFKVVYYAFTKEDRDFYEPIADRLILEVDEEHLDISWNGHPVGLVMLGKKVKVESALVDEHLHFYPKSIKERFAHLMKLDSAPYYPGLVCDAVMKLIK
ncbi:Uncharacterised protein [uncultured archaeon]|nr:Uncharacterised protein [uncultured archaeon]